MLKLQLLYIKGYLWVHWQWVLLFPEIVWTSICSTFEVRATMLDKLRDNFKKIEKELLSEA